MLADLFYREQDIITSLSIATIITLIDNPFNLFSASMQLSYAGSLSIIIFNKIFMEKEDNIKNKIIKYIKASALVSISANIFIIPIMAYNFNTISLTFVFSNLVASPVLCATIIIGLITIIFSFLSINIAYLLGNILNVLLLILIKISNFFSKISLSSITVVTPSIVNIIMYYIICSLVIYFHYTKKKISKKAIVIITIVIIITEMAIIVPIDNCLKIHFIDVNQGDSTLIITNRNKKILIDSGGMTASSKFDIGENVLLPYLLDRRITKLDYVIISHFDSDHCQALETLIGKIKISKLIISKQPTISKEYKEIMNLAINNNIQIVVVKRGDKIQIDKCTYLGILHPSDKFLDDGKGGLNANAIVCKIYFKVDNKYITALFTGDIEKEAEIELEKIYGNKLSADILKVAHHGSKTSSDEKFLKYVNPKIALIGVGEDNNFGHPNGEVLERLKNIGAHIYRTDKMGEISIKIDKEGKIKVKKHINNE